MNVLKMLKDTLMQIEKALINGRSRVLKVSRKFRIPAIYNCYLQPVKIAILIKSSLLFNSFYCLLCL